MIQFQLETKHLQKIFGIQDKNLRLMEKRWNVEISARGNRIKVSGDEDNVSKAEKLLKSFMKLIENGYHPLSGDIETCIHLIDENREVDLVKYFNSDGISLPSSKKVRPKSANQKLYLEAIRTSDIVFAIGPAGTGKTYLAMAMALERLKGGQVKRIVLCRPALEAGEKLGFLPGDLVEKVNPYLRPLYDALYDLTSPEIAQRYIDDEILEIAPLAFMRGRTLANAFIILDEAQNTTSEQMKMFLTRIGISSNAVITGDITQIDLDADKVSGLVEAQALFNRVDDIEIVYFDESDVVRHPLVKKIISLYEAARKNRRKSGAGK
jgi:phosphate starvation-inducible PhoH-like protein